MCLVYERPADRKLDGSLILAYIGKCFLRLDDLHIEVVLADDSVMEAGFFDMINDLAVADQMPFER